ncbi:endoglucanase [Nakamurella panacisegetis]|uniref:Glucanase n=1 Tax=Nakamurella panacisegetis TaxID=1090615 RepID=A0A1H0M014_9ACTN|nr:glycoside hydrolase family 6 protein [Nakamurella panacisegetis]SDO73747.1 endoglucanase [Nakamurella panacisegetis]
MTSRSAVRRHWLLSATGAFTVAALTIGVIWARPASAQAGSSVNLAASAGSADARISIIDATQNHVRTTPVATTSATKSSSTTASSSPTTSASPTASSSPTTSASPTASSAAPTSTSTASASPAALTGRLYVDPASSAASWASANPADALTSRLTTWIASIPTARWFVRDTDANWSNAYVTGAAAAGRVPLMVAYFLPNRDCGSYSSGGAADDTAYLDWITRFATGIGSRPSIVLLEPDSLFYVDCLDATGIAAREALLRNAIAILTRLAPKTVVYLDGGSPISTTTVDQMASRLAAAGVAGTRGFAVNINNFFDDATSRAYGAALVTRLAGTYAAPGTRFLIDSSRNGNGSDGIHWCNPAGRALGVTPVWASGADGLDGWVWFKHPGESDGSCGDAPTSYSGDFVPTLADALMTNAGH